MRRRAAHYSRSLHIGLALSAAAGIALGAWAALRPQPDPHLLTLAIGDLRARASELVALIDERRAGRVIEPYLRAQARQWERVTRDVHRELADASIDDRSGDAARAEGEARDLIELGRAIAEARAPGEATRTAAAQAAQRLIELEQARPR